MINDNKEAIANNFIKYNLDNLFVINEYIMLDDVFKEIFPNKELETSLDEYYKSINAKNTYLTIYGKDWIRFDDTCEISVHAFTPTNASGIYSMLKEVISELDEVYHRIDKGLSVNKLKPVVLFCHQTEDKQFTEEQKRFINFIGNYSNTVCISSLEQLVSLITIHNCNIKLFKENGCK